MSRGTTAGPEGFRNRYGPWALVAGASEGLGAQFATQIAARGVNLVLLARRAHELAVLGDALAAEHGVEVRALTLDLAAPEAMGTAERAPDARATSTAVGRWCSLSGSAGPCPPAGAAESF